MITLHRSNRSKNPVGSSWPKWSKLPRYLLRALHSHPKTGETRSVSNRPTPARLSTRYSVDRCFKSGRQRLYWARSFDSGSG